MSFSNFDLSQISGNSFSSYFSELIYFQYRVWARVQFPFNFWLCCIFLCWLSKSMLPRMEVLIFWFTYCKWPVFQTTGIFIHLKIGTHLTVDTKQRNTCLKIEYIHFPLLRKMCYFSITPQFCSFIGILTSFSGIDRCFQALQIHM